MDIESQQASTDTASNTITAENISVFLRQNPYFFEQHASLLADIHLPSPHGSGAISLTERQQLAQRDKIRVLEVKLAELLEYAEENDATSEKVHQLSLKLLSPADLQALVHNFTQSMLQDFAVAKTTVYLSVPPNNANLANHAVFAEIPSELTAWLNTLTEPYCGPVPEAATSVFNYPITSCCVIPLNDVLNTTESLKIGALFLGADAPQRFKSGMGSHYLNRIGELISVALLKHI